MKKIFKYALAIINNKKLLVVRERGTRYFLLPGGRCLKGETVEDCLKREVMEELGVLLKVETLRFHGSFEDVAANEPERIVHIDLYLGEISGEMRPLHEIEEIRWINSKSDLNNLSPILRNKILPSLLYHKLIE